ncbi:MAG: glycosyltransferase family 39 protein [Nitrospirae bacterium]|nr:glycosyltransferase family 39 protein [Nitrospirota bacterium]
MVDHVKRVISGQKLYISPSLEFIPVYTPFYFYLSAAISSVVGIGFTPLRVISFIASLGCFFVIFLIVKRETGNKLSGLISVGLFAATFPLSGGTFDMIRPDALFLLFTLTALYLIRFETSLRASILSGIIFSLSFLTKQTALIIILPTILYCILSNRKYTIFFISSIVAVMGLSTLAMNYIYDGWYTYYVFNLPSQHPIRMEMFIDFWTKDLILPLFIACIMSAFYLSIQLFDSNKKNILFYSLISIGLIGSSLLLRLHAGGAENVLFPAYAGVSLLFGLSHYRFIELPQILSAVRQKSWEAFFYIICILQFTALIYNPFHHIPKQKDLDAGKKLVNIIGQIKGEIYLPAWGYLSALAGKKTYAHKSAINAILLGENGEVKKKFLDEVNQALREKKFSAIILDSEPWFPEIMEIIERYYVRQELFFDGNTAYWTFNGKASMPGFLYVPKEDAVY